MKSLLCLVFFAGFATFATAQQNESKPSKEETIKWINEKLEKYTITDEEDHEKEQNCRAGHILQFFTRDALTRISILKPNEKDSYSPPALIQNDWLSFWLNEWSLFVTNNTYKSMSVQVAYCDIKDVTVYELAGARFLCIRANSSSISFDIPFKYPIVRSGWGDDATYTVDYSANLVKPNAKDRLQEKEYRDVAFIPFDVNREPDLVKRLNDAFQHLKTFCEAKPKEAF